MPKTIVSLLKRTSEAAEVIRGLEDEREDFLISKNDRLLARLARARDQHRKGRRCPFLEVGRRA